MNTLFSLVKNCFFASFSLVGLPFHLFSAAAAAWRRRWINMDEENFNFQCVRRSKQHRHLEVWEELVHLAFLYRRNPLAMAMMMMIRKER